MASGLLIVPQPPCGPGRFFEVAGRRGPAVRAVAVGQFRAPPETMDLPDPVAGPDDLLVRVEFAGMNPLDWKIADGIYEGHRPHVFPLVLGVDACGTVESAGPRSQRFRRGDRVVGQFLHDPVGRGTYAELALVPERLGIVRVPDEVPSDGAAALPTAGMTAMAAVDALDLETGSMVVIAGASGGIGSFATQIAVARGFRVVALARPASAARLRSLGAAEVIDPTAPEVLSLVAGSHPTGCDGLLDTMSDRAGLARLAGLVRPGGVAVSTTFSADPRALGASKVRAVNIDLHPDATLMERLLREVTEHHLRIPLERRVDLSGAPAALAELKAGHGRGKTVVQLPS